MTRKLPFAKNVNAKVEKIIEKAKNLPEERSNIFTGETVKLPADAAAIYDITMMASVLSEKRPDDLGLIKTLRQGLDWFMKHEPKAYMVLLD
tara:strand:+ start:66 stop:341 length:276 start_codon:yes stop_codon:yes gene_type:complete